MFFFGNSVTQDTKREQARSMAGRVEISDRLTEIPDMFFSGNGRITSVRIPGTVKRIGSRAFSGCSRLRSVVFEVGDPLRIESMAFMGCGIKKLVIPGSVSFIGEEAFRMCDGLEQVTIMSPLTGIEAGAFGKCPKLKSIDWRGNKRPDRMLQIKGITFMEAAKEIPEIPDHGSDPVFKELSEKCGAGDPGAMYAMSEYFLKQSELKESSLFYERASNFWRYRAFLKGDRFAAEWFKAWFKAHPDGRLPSLLPENSNDSMYYFSFSVSGRMLNALGFAFFDADRDYELKHKDGEELVEAGTFDSYEGPDEDGFGAETLYRWYFLDWNMQRVEGVESISCEIRDYGGGEFHEARQKALRIIKGRHCRS